MGFSGGFRAVTGKATDTTHGNKDKKERVVWAGDETTAKSGRFGWEDWAWDASPFDDSRERH